MEDLTYSSESDSKEVIRQAIQATLDAGALSLKAATGTGPASLSAGSRRSDGGRAGHPKGYRTGQLELIFTLSSAAITPMPTIGQPS
jgi:hypothetical protein